MALYHFSAKIISRSKGSACAAAAYRSGEKITNEYDGITSDYRRKRYVDDAVVLLPENAPEEYKDREKLWNSLEKAEKGINAQLAREIEFALPIELSHEERKQIALEFVDEQFVQMGMCADVTFHKAHKKKSTKEGLNDNPHCHVMLPLRPIDENGQWESKNSTLYVCQKNGEQRLMTSQEIKSDPSWEKLFSYKTSDGDSVWRTKSYAVDHPDEGLVLINKFPKRENVQNPKCAEWNSTEQLIRWREAWATKLNTYFEIHGLDERVDHRSYKDQGLDIIPTIHEGKDVTAIERKRLAEYQRKISNGEPAVLVHTDIRNMNIAIKEHNDEIRMIAEIKKLRNKMESIMAPVKERIAVFESSLAEKLERLRAEIISLTVKIKKAVSIKSDADDRIKSNRIYIDDLAPVSSERLERLRIERDSLKAQLESLTGRRFEKMKKELKERIESLDAEISIRTDNRKYAIEAQNEINELQVVSERVGEQISQMQEQRDYKKEVYSSIDSQISDNLKPSVQAERASIRFVIESEYINDTEKAGFQREANSFDKYMNCTVGNLSDSSVKNDLKHDYLNLL